MLQNHWEFTYSHLTKEADDVTEGGFIGHSAVFSQISLTLLRTYAHLSVVEHIGYMEERADLSQYYLGVFVQF